MKNNTYITIQGWMATELKLKGTELIVYSVIYGFSQDGSSVYSGTTTYLTQWTQTTRECVSRTLKSLVQKGLIIKITKIVNGVELYDYKINREILDENNAIKEPVKTEKNTCDNKSGGVIKNHGGCDKKSHHNNKDNKENKNINIFIKESENFIPPSEEEVMTYAKQMNDFAGVGGFRCTKTMAEQFYSHYDSQHWITGSSIPIRNWKTKLKEWCVKARAEELKELNR